MKDVSILYPKLYASGRIDSLERLLDNDSNNSDMYAALKTVVSIECRTFTMDQLSCNFRLELRLYASVFSPLRAPARQSWFYYPVPTGTRRHSYNVDMTKYAKKIFLLDAKWASDLLATRHDLTFFESFLCGVYAGKIRRPLRYLRRHKEAYPEIDMLVRRCRLRLYPEGTGRLRAEPMVGSWVPTGPLAVLGVHPLAGLHLGAGGKKGELSITFFTGFLRTPHPYQVFRKDTLWTRNYFTYYHFGATYTQYLYQRTYWELGAELGAGGDLFVIAPADSVKYSYLKPKSMGSVDGSFGVRLNWYRQHRWHFGLEALYHYVHFDNPKGTDLHGNLFTVQLYVGAN